MAETYSEGASDHDEQKGNLQAHINFTCDPFLCLKS